MASLDDYIKQLSNPVPEYQDPEDDAGDETAARLASRHADSEEAESPALHSTSLRRRAAAYLESDEKYHGKKTSRKDLYDFIENSDDDDIGSENDEGESEIDSDEVVNGDGDSGGDDPEDDSTRVSAEDSDGGEDEEENTLDDSAIEDEEENTLDGSAVSGSDGSEGSEELEDGEEASDEEIASSEDDSEDEDIIQDAEKDEGEKAEAVVQQLDLWDRLMEVRIQLQKVLSTVNSLPIKYSGSTSQQQAETVLGDMAWQLCDLQAEKPLTRKRKADTDLAELAQENFTTLQTVRNKSISFWDEKTRLTSKKFKSFNSFNTPVLKQVEQILSDRDRLIRRTQVNRDTEAADVEPEEIFDDNDFYQRLLRNLIESKSADDSSMLSSSTGQWLELQKLRGKKKKNKDVDTKASKGRKLRYNVHSKLVNFMAPRDDSTWAEDAKNELFKNLFKMPTTATEQ